jgi:hypothetical protein
MNGAKVPFLVPCLAAIITALPSRAGACQSEYEPFEQAAAHTDDIFVARVVAWDPRPMFQGAPEFHPRQITVQVLETIKGRAQPRYMLLTGYGGGLCDAATRTFPVGSVWAFLPSRLYADEPPGEALRVGHRSWYRVNVGLDGTPDPALLQKVREFAYRTDARP